VGLAALGISVKLVRVIIAIGGAVFFSIIGTAIFGKWGGIFGAMLGLGGIAAAFAAPIGQLNLESLGERYQSKKDTYDQAAVCYFRWVIDGTLAKFMPSEILYFLRDYRFAVHANTELRDALFDAFLAQVCGLRFEYDKWYLLDHTFTGSPRQKEILRECLIWKEGEGGASKEFIEEFTQRISKVEQAHAAGVDLEGVDLRLPSAYSVLKELLNGASLQDAIGPDLISCASAGPYCAKFADVFAESKYQEQQRIAAIIQADSSLFAQNVTGLLISKASLGDSSIRWIVCLVVCVVGFIGLMALASYFANNHAIDLKGGIICLSLAFLGSIPLIWLSIRRGKRRQHLRDLLSRKPS
jgi:hypothetical protein